MQPNVFCYHLSVTLMDVCRVTSPSARPVTWPSSSGGRSRSRLPSRYSRYLLSSVACALRRETREKARVPHYRPPPFASLTPPVRLARTPLPFQQKFWARADITVTYSPMRDVKLGHYIQNIVFKTLNLGRIFFVAICFTKKLGNVFRPLQHLIRYRYGRYLLN